MCTVTEAAGNERRHIPDFRQDELFGFEHGGIGYIVGFGRYPDGALAEIFPDREKRVLTAETATRDSAVLDLDGIWHAPLKELIDSGATLIEYAAALDAFEADPTSENWEGAITAACHFREKLLQLRKAVAPA
jgi:hypothetical protein